MNKITPSEAVPVTVSPFTLNFWLCTVVLGGLIIYSATVFKDRQIETAKRINSATQVKISAAAAQVPAVFQKWSEAEVLANGDVQLWKGSDAELLFIDPIKDCDRITATFDGEELIVNPPCWDVWARTPSGRYFVERIVLQNEFKLAAYTRHRNAEKKEVVESALRLDRKDILAKLGVSPGDA